MRCIISLYITGYLHCIIIFLTITHLFTIMSIYILNLSHYCLIIFLKKPFASCRSRDTREPMVFGINVVELFETRPNLVPTTVYGPNRSQHKSRPLMLFDSEGRLKDVLSGSRLLLRSIFSRFAMF